MWKIEKIVSKGDYNYAVVNGHPHAIKHGYVLEHRIVMENHLGRLLDQDEAVHHLNGDTKDNRIENLEVFSNSDHKREHMRTKGRSIVTLKCPECKNLFERRKGQTYLQKGGKFTACSARCRGKFSRRLQTCSETAELERAISENLVEEHKYIPPKTPSKPSDKGMRRDHTPSTCNGEEMAQPANLYEAVMET